MKEDQLYPISEIFTSPQGEGVYCGTAMTFVRLAGCSVGKPLTVTEYHKFSDQFPYFRGSELGIYGEDRPIPIQQYTEKCTLYDGRQFLCDTDFSVKQRMTAKQIFEQIPKGVRHICITGGEPFIHNLNNLVRAADDKGIKVHVETSGTVPLRKAFPVEEEQPSNSDYKDCSYLLEDVWITVSPKYKALEDMVERADEIKLLVDKNFDPTKIPDFISDHPTVFIQPVNNEFSIDVDNLRLCMEWHKKYPKWRVSLQLHKVLSHHLKELVR